MGRARHTVSLAVLLASLALLHAVRADGSSAAAEGGEEGQGGSDFQSVMGAAGPMARVTVDGIPCQLPVVVDDETHDDCVLQWDGQEWCPLEDETWHVCRSRYAMPGHRMGLFNLIDSAQVAQAEPGSGMSLLTLINSVNDTQTEPAGEGEAEAEGEASEGEVDSEVAEPEPEPAIDFRALREKTLPTLRGPVIVSEFMSSNKRTLKASPSKEGSEPGTPDWIELQNVGVEAVSLAGWFLSDDEEVKEKWPLPDVTLAPQALLVVFASGQDTVVAKPGGREYHTNFKLSSKGGYLGLFDPQGGVAFEIRKYPPQYEDVSFGQPDGSALLSFLQDSGLGVRGRDSEGGAEDEEIYGYLALATPGARNSNARLMGPAVFDVTERMEEPVSEGEGFAVEASLYPVGTSDIEGVYLHFRQNSLAEARMNMTPVAVDEESGSVRYRADIPPRFLAPGTMLRWYVTAKGKGMATRQPAVVGMDSSQYYGTVVKTPDEGSNGLPVMHIFTSQANAIASEKGGKASLFYLGKLYDNVAIRRRGQTTMRWKKPKFKVDFKGSVFRFAEGERKVEEFNLQSHFFELGSQTYMREDLASNVFREAGVPTPIVFPLELRMNGQFYGYYSFVEQIDDHFLKRNHLSTSGPLYKAWHIWKSNLRWDVEPEQMQWAYRKGNLKEVKTGSKVPGSYDDLKAFATGLVGKGKTRSTWSRANYIFDHVDLPEVVNEMAAQSIVLNQDRLTKNYYVYFNPETDEWLRLPWDLEAAFGISGKLGGEPSKDYCVLDCEQFNSPLYGDSEHPQDVRDFYDGSRWNRRKLSWAPPYYYDPYAYGRRRMEPQFTCEDPGPEGTKCFGSSSPKYADGTFNYLSDAILDIPATREMYLRRLRTLMDQFLNGRLEEIVTEQYRLIRRCAKLDDMKWKRGDVDEGFEQLVTEQLPRRREQLYGEYGPEGSGLIPGPQKASPRVRIESAERPRAEGDTQWFVEVRNDEQEAVDVTGWRLDGDTKFIFRPGTVIPAERSVFLSPDVKQFRARLQKPTGGERRFVQGPLEGALPVQGAGGEAALTLYNAKDILVDEY